MTPAGKGQNGFYFTFIEAQIAIRTNFLGSKQGKLKTLWAAWSLSGLRNSLSADIPDLLLELSCGFSVEMSIYIWISECLGRICHKGEAEMARAGCPAGRCSLLQDAPLDQHGR